MNILIIDAQGGGLGRQLVAAVKRALPEHTVTAVGTNSAATANMLKGGADQAATGENAVVVCSRRADVIAGPMGIVIADSMLGEITAEMALAVGRSPAVRVLLPVNRCSTLIAGSDGAPTSLLLEDAVAKIRSLAGDG